MDCRKNIVRTGRLFPTWQSASTLLGNYFPLSSFWSRQRYCRVAVRNNDEVNITDHLEQQIEVQDIMNQFLLLCFVLPLESKRVTSFAQNKAVSFLHSSKTCPVTSIISFKWKVSLLLLKKFDLVKECINLPKMESTCLNSSVLPSTTWYLTSLCIVISVLAQNAAMTFLRRDPSLLGFDRQYLLPIETNPLWQTWQ